MDEFEKLRYDVYDFMNDLDTIINSRDVLEHKTEGLSILEKHKLQAKIDEKLYTVKNLLSQMKLHISSQIKKKKNINYKLELYDLLLNRYNILKSKNEGQILYN
jgi:hypothetical protein